jgi:PBSX family phage portal protein
MAPDDGEITAEERINEVAGPRDVLMKAYSIGLEKAEKQSSSSADSSGVVQMGIIADVIEPPYDPQVLCKLYEHSSSLRQNVDAYATNIDGFGHVFEPLVELKEAGARELVADAIYLERSQAINEGVLGSILTTNPPSEAEVSKKIEDLRYQMRVEKARIDSFFENCVAEESFTRLRRKTREDIEVTGNGYWEVIRNDSGQISQFAHMPSRSVRVMKEKSPSISVTQPIRVSLLLFRHETFKRRFRRYVQIGDEHAWFKEFGDPTVVSNKTGKSFENVEALRAVEGSAQPANEVFHFKIPSLKNGSYGVPRWIGNLLSVLGSRSAEEVNLAYFDNKSIPPMAILVSGGRLGSDSVKRIESFVETQLKGRKNYHKILVIEAETTAGSIGLADNNGSMRVEIKMLTDAQLKDGLFLAYDAANMDKVGMGFRLPRLLRGDIRDFNRACYSADTETLTENGWKLHHEIASDERIAVFDPKACELRFEVPSAKHVYDVDENLYRFNSQHIDANVTANHTMLVRCPGRGWTFEAAADTATRSRFEVMCAPEVDSHGETIGKFVLPKQCQIERGHSHGPIAGDDWLEFLGYFLSDGGLLETDNPAAEYLVFIRQQKEPCRSKMQACLDRIGWAYSIQIKADGANVFCISNRCLRGWLLEHCGGRSAGRHMPAGYATGLPRAQLKILWQAMLLGDGSCGKQSTNGSYYSASRALIDDVQIVALRLGLRSLIRWAPNAHVFQLGWSTWKTTQLKDFHVEAERYKGEVFCFTCPGAGFFVTRRNGKIAIQGNSAEAALDFAESQVFVPERNDFDFTMNRFILASFGIRYWRFKSNGPRLSDAQSWGEMIVKLTNAGVLVPADARELTSKKVLAQELPVIKADWVNQPLSLTIAGIQADNALDGEIPMAVSGPSGSSGTNDQGIGVTPTPSLLKAAKDKLMRKAKSLVKLRNEFLKQQAVEAVKEYQDERVDEGEIVFQMSAAEMEEHFGIKPQ